MEKRYKGRERHISFMMKGKTLATIGALTALGLAVYSASGAPSIGQLAQSMESNPSAWTVAVGANANAADVVGASNIVAGLETFTSVPTSSSVSTSSLQVQLQGQSAVIPNSYPFYLQGAPLYLGNSLNSSLQAIQVGSGSFATNVNGQTTTYQYTAYVQPLSNYQLKYVQTSTSSSSPQPNVALAASSQATAFSLTVFFEPGVDVTQLQTSPQPITLFNTSYYLYYNPNQNYLYLVPAAQVETLYSGQSYVFNGVNITVGYPVAQYTTSLAKDKLL
ncbi:MAG: hypothetical protein ACP5GJ_04135 [Nanopusillaceae archaeon]